MLGSLLIHVMLPQERLMLQLLLRVPHAKQPQLVRITRRIQIRIGHAGIADSDFFTTPTPLVLLGRIVGLIVARRSILRRHDDVLAGNGDAVWRAGGTYDAATFPLVCQLG